MKRILLALFFGYLFGAVVFGQEPVAVELQVVEFEKIFEVLTGSVVEIFKELWVILLSMFFLWVFVEYAKSYLDGKEHTSAINHHERIIKTAERMEEREDARRLLRQQELEESRCAEKFEVEYRSRELRDFLFRDRQRLNDDHESIVQIDGSYYVRASTSEGDVIGHQTLDKWRAERDVEDSKPLSFDNNDYGKVYESIVESDYRGRLDDEYREIFNTDKSEPDELGLYDPAPYEEDEHEEWRKEGDDLVEKNQGMVDWLNDSVSKRIKDRKHARGLQGDDFGLDSESDFERDYGHRRGEFRGGY